MTRVPDYELWFGYLKVNDDYLDISSRFLEKDYERRILIKIYELLDRNVVIHNKAVNDIKSIIGEMLALCLDKPLDVVKRSIQCYLFFETRRLLNVALGERYEDEVFYLDVTHSVLAESHLGIDKLRTGPGRIRRKELKKYLTVYLLKREGKQWKEIIKVIDEGLYKRIVGGDVLLESARRDYQNYLSKAKSVIDNSLSGMFPGKY